MFDLEGKFSSPAKLERAKICLDEMIKTVKEQYEVTHSYECGMDLAMSYNNLGILLDDLGKHSEARKSYEEAVELREALTDETDAIGDRRDLADSYNNLGDVLRKLGKLSEARKVYEDAIYILKSLAVETESIKDR